MFNGNRLRDLRKKTGLTQEALGNMINVTKVSICCYEKGTRTPSLEILSDLANIFGVDANFFLGKDMIIKEKTTEYTHYFSKEEVKIIQELRKNKDLYKLITEDPKRMIELIDKKLK